MVPQDKISEHEKRVCAVDDRRRSIRDGGTCISNEEKATVVRYGRNICVTVTEITYWKSSQEEDEA